jgi:hypothetical protein
MAHDCFYESNVPSATHPRTGKLFYLSAIAMLEEIAGALRDGHSRPA